MKVHKLALIGAVLALASPVYALAQSTQLTVAQAQSAALNALKPSDRAQVRNILALEQSKQIDAGSAAVQIDSVLSDNEAKAVLAEAAKSNSKAADAGVFLASSAD